MKQLIYVKLLNEGTLVFRPVLSDLIEDNIFKMGGKELYDAEDEQWEYAPDTLVTVAYQLYNDEQILVAVNAIIRN